MALLSARRRWSSWPLSGGAAQHVCWEPPGMIWGLAKEAAVALIAVPARLLIRRSSPRLGYLKKHVLSVFLLCYYEAIWQQGLQGKSIISGHAIKMLTWILSVLVKCQMGTCAWFLSGWSRSSEFCPKKQWWPHSSCGVINRLLVLGNTWHFMGREEIERVTYLHSVYYHTPAAVSGAWPLAPCTKVFLPPPLHCEGVGLQKSGVLCSLDGRSWCFWWGRPSQVCQAEN